MNVDELVRCPACRSPLRFGAGTCTCEGCGRSYPVFVDIPDLRVPIPSAWIDYEQDRDFARSLAESYDSSTFEELVERVWPHRQTTPAHMVERRLREIRQATEKYREALADGGWLSGVVGRGGAPTLEVGCGPGGFLEAAAGVADVAGMDISLMWLVIARKRLDESGVSCPLVCACVEQMPFADGTFAGSVAFDVLEHVAEPAAMVREIWRVTSDDASVLCTTPNRFSLSAEPHVGVWGVGWLPQAWRRRFVRWRNGMTYEHTFPMSLRDLRRLFRGLGTVVVETPELWRRDIESFRPAKRAIGKLYNRIVAGHLLGRIVLPIAPFFRLVARKSV